MDLKAVAADKEAMEMGGRLFQTYCMRVMAPRLKVRVTRVSPTWTDKDWQWGGEPEQIIETITNGRIGMMPAWGGNEEAVGGEAGAKEVANYVRSLSGLKVDGDLANKGKDRFNAVCFACHGPDGKGMQALGAPNLTDKAALR